MVEARFFGRAAVAVIAAEAQSGSRIGPAVPILRRVVARVVSGKDLDGAGSGVDAPDVVGPLGGDVDGAIVSHGDAAVGVHLGVDRGPTIPSAADLPAARKARNDPGLVVYPPVGVVL